MSVESVHYANRVTANEPEHQELFDQAQNVQEAVQLADATGLVDKSPHAERYNVGDTTLTLGDGGLGETVRGQRPGKAGSYNVRLHAKETGGAIYEPFGNTEIRTSPTSLVEKFGPISEVRRASAVAVTRNGETRMLTGKNAEKAHAILTQRVARQIGETVLNRAQDAQTQAQALLEKQKQ